MSHNQYDDDACQRTNHHSDNNNSCERSNSRGTLLLVLATSLVHLCVERDEISSEKTIDTGCLKVNEAAAMLSDQWTRGGSANDYYQKIISNSYGLPASYLLIQQYDATAAPDNDVDVRSNEQQEELHLQCTKAMERSVLIGHGRLTECYESLAGNAAAATYIIINDKYRKCGYGSVLMDLLEREAMQLGYHYMYLWTNTAINFYKKLGYQETERVSLHRACLKPLQYDQVNKLEDMLRLKQEKIVSAATAINSNVDPMRGNTSKSTETILLPPIDENVTSNENDVWLRKRLVECVNTSTLIPLEERIGEIKDGIDAYNFRVRKNKVAAEPINVSTTLWKYHLVQVPWQQQVGPSCGLAALRMIREYYYGCNNTNNTKNGNHTNNTDGIDDSIPDNGSRQSSYPEQQGTAIMDIKMPSLLNEAKDLGYTDDGEVFDANNLIKLAINCCGISRCTMQSCRDLKPRDLLQIIGPTNKSNEIALNGLKQRNSNGLLIIPYDTSKITRIPCNNSGLTAHYGIIVGLVIGSPDETCNGYRNDDGNHDCDQTILLEELDYKTYDSILNDSTDILLLVQHGLSSKLSIASWNEFVESNQQLVSYNKVKYNKVSNLDLQDRIIVCESFYEI